MNNYSNYGLQQGAQGLGDPAPVPDKPIVELKKKLQARADHIAQRIAEAKELESELPKVMAAVNALASEG